MTEQTQQNLPPDPAAEPTPQQTTTNRVFDAVRELHALGQIASREKVQEISGLRQTIVDDRLRALADEGKLRRLTRGVYEVMATFPAPRAQSISELDDGRVLFELGDIAFTMTPAEARKAGRLLGGFGSDATLIDTATTHLRLAADTAAEVVMLKRELKAVRALLNMDDDGRQMALIGGE